MTLQELNSLSTPNAETELLRCCGSRRWAAAMASERPFATIPAALARGDEVWAALGRADWLEAFSHHPRIGAKDGDLTALRARFAPTRDWSQQEQKGVSEASEATLQKLAQGNADYEQRFGHVFLICATGKGAEEMLSALTARIGNSPDVELKIAAGEQAKITRIRMEKLLHS